MAMSPSHPTDRDRRAYMLKLRVFRDSLTAREQRMLDAVVLASYWPTEAHADVQAYSLRTPEALYDDTLTAPPFEATPWGRICASLP